MHKRVATILVALLTPPFVAAAELHIREWRVPYEDSRPRDPFAESAMSVWFVGQRSGYLANFDTQTGSYTQVALFLALARH